MPFNKDFLRLFMQYVRAVDLGHEGKRFTWKNRQYGKVFIKGRLGIFFANMYWLKFFNKATVEHLVVESSNHAFIMLNIVGGSGWEENHFFF